MWYGGVIGLIILILDIYAIVKVFESSASILAKVIWTIVIIVLPLIGLIAWAIFGPKGAGRLA